MSKNNRDPNLNNLSSSILQSIGNSIINSNNFGKMDSSLFRPNNFSNNMNMTQNKNSSFIKVSSKGNLRTTMETLDLIPEYEEKEMDDVVGAPIKNVDLFKNNKISDLKLDKKDRYGDNSDVKLEDVNQFNKTILGTNNWGELNNKLSNKENSTSNSYFKPQKKEIEREVGKSIQNTKLPRARLPTKAIERQNLNRISKAVVKDEEEKTLFNSTSLSFLKPSSFSKVFNQILGKNK